ncbi:hypothetical protein PY650_34625 [Rhizobium calliandrae]|uniref:Uncharacterized protein n=1 Tax=Rhizobium calliandrae TaxID=1312182 RepID=A0ABT7KSS6_9HYPH|nr:hypothetical protein [Rhizobium calliandrae]MDL2410618.1 hypothetical protein [Rhizobium calliandrae]
MSAELACVASQNDANAFANITNVQSVNDLAALHLTGSNFLISA